MRPLLLTILTLLVPLTTAQSSQSLTDAIANYSQLSTLSTLLASQPAYLAFLSSTNSTNGTGPRTLLLPSNTAFTNLYNATGSGNTSIPNVAAQFQYHTLDGAVTSQQLNQPVGFLANSLLKQDLYNHRNNSDVGQVVYLAGVRNGTANVTSGEGDVATMVVVDGQWAGGWFQIVDEYGVLPLSSIPTLLSFTMSSGHRDSGRQETELTLRNDSFLTLPENCQSVMRDKNATLSSLAASLNRTNLWDTLNTFPNVTCLAPNNVAFSAAGSPQTNLGVNQLGEALKFHTIAGATYSPLLHDGLMLSSVNGAPIKVSVNGSGTYFNDAKVLQSNVITNNGVIHILDKVGFTLLGNCGEGGDQSVPENRLTEWLCRSCRLSTRRRTQPRRPLRRLVGLRLEVRRGQARRRGYLAQRAQVVLLVRRQAGFSHPMSDSRVSWRRWEFCCWDCSGSRSSGGAP
jgi:uncharacterized surface protein with fasciclin (FAS1) repeats